MNPPSAQTRGSQLALAGLLAACFFAPALAQSSAATTTNKQALPALEIINLRPVARIQSDQISESSGLVASRRFPGVLWTHNDSGDRARIFAISTTGDLISEIAVLGAANQDWEDIAIDDRGRLFLGDIGNNANQRRDLAVYVAPEPDPRTATSVEVEQILRFRFPEMPYPPPPNRRNFDAESLFVAGDQLYLLTKHRSNTKTRLYRFPATAGSRQVVLELVGEIDIEGAGHSSGGMATGADITADGRYLAVLSYHALLLFERPLSGDNYLAAPVRRIDLARNRLRQCESIAWLGNDLWIGNEQRDLYHLTGQIPASTSAD